MVDAAIYVPYLRPYQQEIAEAVLDSINNGKGLTFSVEIARQGGKNELSALIERLALLSYLQRPVNVIKCAPTFRPQCLLSMRRLAERLNDSGLQGLWRLEAGHIIRLGEARVIFLSAEEGANVVAIPKTMDNDVPGTDYCIGFSTCVTRTIELTHSLRTTAGSHERFLVIEVFGRYAGFTALLPTMAGAADRCIIPEHPSNMDHLTKLLSEDRRS